MSNVSKLLSNDGFIMVNKHLIRTLGLNVAVLLGELCREHEYWESTGKLDKDNAFYSTQKNIRDNTGLTEYAQREALEILKHHNIIKVIRKEIPAKNYFIINNDALIKLFDETSNNKLCENEELDQSKSNLNNSKQIKENQEYNSFSKEKEEKPNSKTKKNQYVACNDYIMQYTNNIVLRDALEKFLRLLLEKKNKEIGFKFYTNQWPSIVNELDNITSDTNEKIKIVNKSVQCGWNRFYPLKNNNSSVKSHPSEANVSCTKMTEEEKKAQAEFIEDCKRKGLQYEF